MKKAARIGIGMLWVVVGCPTGAAGVPLPMIPGAPGAPGILNPAEQSIPLRPMPAVKTPQLDECIEIIRAGGITGNFTATALGPFTVQLNWSAPAGTYDLRSDGDDTSLRTTVQHSAASVAIDKPTANRLDKSAVMRVPVTTAGSDVAGTFRHEPALPAAHHAYTIRGTLADGRGVCGHASADTPAPPLPIALRGRYVDPRNIVLGMTAPPYTRSMRVLRDGRVVAEPLIRSATIAVGPQGQPLADFHVDRPGPPPFPYTFASGSAQYLAGQPSYDFTIETTWQMTDGGPTRVVQTVLKVPGPAPIVGFADLHAHQFSYLGFGGNPATYPLGRHFVGKAFGPIEMALNDCTNQHGPRGIFDLGNFAMHLAAGLPVPVGHPVGGVYKGRPYFDGWPRWDSFTHQQMYEDWLKRAHDKGLQLMVTHAVNNQWMCATLNALPHERQALAYTAMGATGLAILGAPTPENISAAGAALTTTLVGLLDQTIVQQATVSDPQCRDIDATENQINEAFAMQNDIDARSGGPGRGWYRIVRSPIEAREVIQQGKLAVVLGVEVDNLFDCAKNGSPCTPAFVDSILTNYYNRGVRHMFPVHFYDNQFGGSANSNALISKRFRNPSPKVPCQVDTNSRTYGYDGGLCNGNGLEALGTQLINGMMSRGMIVDVDHMSQRTFNDTMNLVTPRGYPVVSSHSGFTEIAAGDQFNEGNRSPPQITRMLQVGGMFTVIPHQGTLGEILTYVAPPGFAHPVIAHTCGNSSETVAQAFMYAVDKTGNGPVAFGSDFNGFAGWPGPRLGPEACPGGKGPNYAPKAPLDYNRPIVAAGLSIPMNRSVIGQKTYDLNVDGLAHVGMLPDLIADFQAMGMGPAELNSMFESSEGYIRLWERASYLSGGD